MYVAVIGKGKYPTTKNKQANMSNSSVTLNSKLTVVSSKPVSSGNKAHSLSSLDHAMSSHTLHVIFYYKNEENWFESFGLDPLRESLSEVLTLYPTVTGRLARGVDGGWEVKCNDAGVRVIMASVDVTLDEWLKSASGTEEKLLVAWDDMPQDPTTWSPFRIQINSFQGGGIAIGLSCSHMVADLTFLASSFFKSWTQLHRHVPITHPPLVTPLPIHTDAESLPRHVNTSPSPTNMATATFKFSTSTIKQCLSKVHDTCPNATPFDFLAALFWTRIARFKPPKSHDQTHSLTLCTDFRTLLKPSLPLGYFGNALCFSKLSQNVKNMQREQLGDTVNKVHSHLKELSQKQTLSTLEVNNYMYYGEELTCVCMEQLMVEESSLLYDAVFSENDKPVHVSCRVGNVKGEGLIMVMPCSEGGFSRTVMVMLPEEELLELRKDEVILELEPVMVLAGSKVDH